MAQAAVAEQSVDAAQLAAQHGLRLVGGRPGLVAYTRQVWAYRYFIAAFATAKLVASFSSARLGRLWQVLTPLVNAAVYFLLFGVVLDTRRNIDNFVAYLCIGIFLFTFTQAVVFSGVGSIADNLNLVRALHFPRACLPIALTLTQLQQMLVSTGVLLVIVLVTGEPLTPWWLLVAPALLLQSLFNVGLAMIMARLGARMNDLRQLMPFVMRTWMYGSGVFYSVETFAEYLPPAVANVLHANPLMVYIELVRHALLTSPPLTSPPLRLWLFGIGWALVLSVGGYVFFWRGEQEYGRA
jgi:teichoic acid transport system permease protein